jgi:Secretion system C-terminal sorting domain
MKKIYLQTFLTSTLTLIFFFNPFNAISQCPYGGTPGSTAYDTTIRLGAGIVNTQVKFPKFDPQNGMVTCVRLCVTIKGIIDTIAMENYTNAPQFGAYTYIRKDTITGPGIPTYLTSSATISSPSYPNSYPLGPNNFVPFSGPDLYTQGPDTVLSRVLCLTISDSAAITQFYGVNDTVTYDYKVDAILNDIVSGGSAFKFVLSSALVNFNFQYCTCPAAVLPLSIRDLVVKKIADNKAELSWDDYDEQPGYYRYEVEMSKDGRSFATVGQVAKNTTNNKDLYKFIYTTGPTEKGMLFFRVKQIYAMGYTRFSDVKQVYLENSPTPKFTVFPNPSTGIVGIKFDNVESGKMIMQVFNSRGQKVLQKDIIVAGSSYQQLGTLEGGIYWLRMTDEKNRLSFVNQLMIK